MADVYREPFFYARRYAPHRDRVHGRSSGGVPRQRFIVSSQNHDQVGNRPKGERLALLVGPDRQRLAEALVLLSPYVPMLFMGEEYGETAPFLYFIEHGDAALVEPVRAGRERAFEATGAFEALRVMPLQHDIYDAMRSRRALFCAFNLCGHPMNVPVRADAIGAWKLRFSTEALGYGGTGEAVSNIPPEAAPTAAADAPKRLLEPIATESRIRVVRLPAWSAVVYVRDFDHEGAERTS